METKTREVGVAVASDVCRDVPMGEEGDAPPSVGIFYSADLPF